ALLRLHRRPVDVARHAADGLAVERFDADAIRGELGHLAVFEEQHLLRVAEQCGNVAATQRFTVAQPDHEWGRALGHHDPIRLTPAYDGERVRSANLAEREAHGFE